MVPPFNGGTIYPVPACFSLGFNRARWRQRRKRCLCSFSCRFFENWMGPPPPVALTPNAIVALNGGDVELRPIVQVLDVRQIGTAQNVQERFRLVLSDGSAVQQAMLATQLNEHVKNGKVQKGTIVQLQEYICNTVQNRKIIIVLNMDVLVICADLIGDPKQVISTEQSVGVAASNMQHQPPHQLHPPQPVPQQAQTYQPPPQLHPPQLAPQQAQTYQPPHQVHPPQPAPQQAQPYGNYRGSSASGVTNNANIGNATPAVSSYGQHSPFGRSATYQPAPAPSYTNRGPIARNEAPASIIPIAALNPYQGRWTIKARVTAKSDLRRYNNAKGDGKVFNFDLLDAEGGEIRVTCFNAIADQFFERVEVGRLYLVSKGTLKGAQKAYNHLKNEWEIMFDKDSILDPCPDDTSVPHQVFDFRPISEIENMANNETVDIIGVVVGINQTSTIMRKNGTETQKRTLQLRDTSGKSVELTMWGTFCGREGQELQELFDSGQFPILAVKVGRISDFSGRTVGTIASTQLQINPDIPEAHTLRQWYDREGRHASAQSISREGAGSIRADSRKTVSQIKDEGLGRSDKPDFITMKATIHFVKTDNFCYTACPLQVGDRQCNKKVTNNGDGTWRCDRCDRTVPECEYRYLLSLQVMDHTGATWFTAFQEAAEELVGVSAKDLFLWKQEENARFLDHISNLQFSQHYFKLRIKEESFQDEQRVKSTIMKAERCDFSTESKYLIEIIGKLRRGEPMSAPSTLSTPAPASASPYGTAYGGTGRSGVATQSNASYAGATGNFTGFGAGNGGNSSSAGYGGGYNSAGGYGAGASAGGHASGGYGGGSNGGYGGGGAGCGGGGGGFAGSGGASTGGNACFKCGQGGHWARDCPNQGGGGSRNAGYTGGYGNAGSYGSRQGF